MDLIGRAIRMSLIEAIENGQTKVVEQQPTTQQQTQQANQPPQTQQNGNEQIQAVQMQQFGNKFNEISGLLGNIVNTSSTTLNNAKQLFKNGIGEMTKCAQGFNEKYKNSLSNAISSFEKGSAELDKLQQVLQNIQQLQQNIQNITGGGNQQQEK